MTEKRFTRSPITKMMIGEVSRTTHALEKGEGQYETQKYITPTGRTVGKITIMGTAVETEDRSGESMFWTMRVVDPTGSIQVTAGQYQPEAMRIIAEAEIPSHMIITGKIHIYEPEPGEKKVSIRADTIHTADRDTRDKMILDTAISSVREFPETPETIDKLKEIYGPNHDLEAYRILALQAIESLLDLKPEPEMPEKKADPEQKKEPEKKVPKSKSKEKETKKETKKKEAIRDIQDVIFDIITEKGEINFDDLPDLLREQDVNPGMIDWGSAVKWLIMEGKAFEPVAGRIKVKE